MKPRPIFLILLALTGLLSLAALPASSTQIVASQDTNVRTDVVTGSKVPAATNTPEALAAAGTYVNAVTIWAGRGSRTANTSSVWIDWTSGNDTQQIEIPVGGFITLASPIGKYLDLADLYVDAVTLTDGVYYRGFR